MHDAQLLLFVHILVFHLTSEGECVWACESMLSVSEGTNECRLNEGTNVWGGDCLREMFEYEPVILWDSDSDNEWVSEWVC